MLELESKINTSVSNKIRRNPMMHYIYVFVVREDRRLVDNQFKISLQHKQNNFER